MIPIPILLFLAGLLCQLSPSAATCQANVVPVGTMARLFYSVSDSQESAEKAPMVDLECSAIVLNSYWLLSPASCLFDHNNPARYKIFVHSNDQELVQSPIVANKIILNPSFHNELGAGYDFALINVLTKMSLECPVYLPNENSDDMNTCSLVKWPKNNKSNKFHVLTPVDVQIQANTCKFGKHVTSGETGARLVECAKVSVCQGEAGAVVLCASIENAKQFYVRDISSWGDTFCKKDPDYLFTKISHYSKWINGTIWSS